MSTRVALTRWEGVYFPETPSSKPHLPPSHDWTLGSIPFLHWKNWVFCGKSWQVILSQSCWWDFSLSPKEKLLYILLRFIQIRYITVSTHEWKPECLITNKCKAHLQHDMWRRASTGSVIFSEPPLRIRIRNRRTTQRAGADVGLQGVQFDSQANLISFLQVSKLRCISEHLFILKSSTDRWKGYECIKADKVMILCQGMAKKWERTGKEIRICSACPHNEWTPHEIFAGQSYMESQAWSLFLEISVGSRRKDHF